jgi:competence protein ComEC
MPASATHPAAAGTAWAAVALAWLLGVALQLQQAALWPAWMIGALFALAAIAALAAWRLHRTGHALWMVGVTLGLATLMLAFASTAGRAQWRMSQTLPPALEGQDLQVTGVVASLPRQSVIGTRFEFDVEAALWQGRPVRLPPRLSLGWYRGFDDDALLAAPAAALRVGERWRFTVRLRQPHGLMNPHGFDLELWLFERGLRASGTVRAPLNAPPASTSALAPQHLADAAGYPVQRLRQRLRDALFAAVPESATAGVLAALVVGDQAAIEREDWDLYRQTGVAHLMSISGLHVTMFAWLAAAIVSALWRRSPRLALACPTPMAARWGGLLAALAYAVLAGWGVPAQRTVGMIALVVMVRSAGLRWPLHAVLLAAAVAVTLADPWALLQPGFWLSFVAVALLVASEPGASAAMGASTSTSRLRRAWTGLGRAVGRGLRTQAVATAGLAPLTLVFFQQLSLVGFVANLVAIPVITLGVVPLALLGTLYSPLWTLAAAGVQALDGVLRALAAWPGAVWVAAAAPPWVMAAGLLGGVLAVLPLPWRARLLALPLVLPLLAPPMARPPAGQFELLAADVGQGTAVLVRTRSHLLVYDTGPPFSPEADAGERVLLPLLQARGEWRVDHLVLSHGDADHIGGAASLLQGLPVAAVSSSLPADHVLLATGVPHSRCLAGQRWQWDGVQFEFLHPLPTDHDSAQKTNALSCVLRVQAAAGPDGAPPRSALLTGDIEAAQEAALVQRLGSGLHSTVLLVPHHGSRTSSTPDWLIAVAPQVAVVQAAYRSRFGHPATDVLSRYARYGIALERSDVCGAWFWPADGPPQCERQVARRYWHHQPLPGPALTP